MFLLTANFTFDELAMSPLRLLNVQPFEILLLFQEQMALLLIRTQVEMVNVPPPVRGIQKRQYFNSILWYLNLKHPLLATFFAQFKYMEPWATAANNYFVEELHRIERKLRQKVRTG